jgi:hypothetical protein
MTTADVLPGHCHVQRRRSRLRLRRQCRMDTLTYAYSLPLHLYAVSLDLAYDVRAEKGRIIVEMTRTRRSGTDPASLLETAGIAVANTCGLRSGGEGARRAGPATEPPDNRRDGGSWPPGQMRAPRWYPAGRRRSSGPQSVWPACRCGIPDPHPLWSCPTVTR